MNKFSLLFHLSFFLFKKIQPTKQASSHDSSRLFRDTLGLLNFYKDVFQTFLNLSFHATSTEILCINNFPKFQLYPYTYH